VKGLGQQGVPRQDRQPLAENDMIRRPASPVIVVVHSRQVIVNQGVGMDHLQGTGAGKGIRPGAAYHLGGGQAEDGAEPLAARKEAVAGGVHYPFRHAGLRGEKAVQGLLH